jgi:hypothetical protein
MHKAFIQAVSVVTPQGLQIIAEAQHSRITLVMSPSTGHLALAAYQRPAPLHPQHRQHALIIGAARA